MMARSKCGAPLPAREKARVSPCFCRQPLPKQEAFPLISDEWRKPRSEPFVTTTASESAKYSDCRLPAGIQPGRTSYTTILSTISSVLSGLLARAVFPNRRDKKMFRMMNHPTHVHRQTDAA